MLRNISCGGELPAEHWQSAILLTVDRLSPLSLNSHDSRPTQQFQGFVDLGFDFRILQ